MLRSSEGVPTLGCFSKVVCDVLGLWGGEDKDVLFKIPAKEKERRKVLREAFEELGKEGGYGRLDELLTITTERSPSEISECKKLRTVQSYANHLSKEDFSSYDEFIEFGRYVDIVIKGKFSQGALCDFASRFYSSSIMHYREFVREHAPKVGMESFSYAFFVNNVLFDLIDSIGDAASSNMSHSRLDSGSGKWPLRSFVDSAVELCGTSLHKLHQFHEVKINSGCCEKEVWGKDLKGQKVNTRSKQVIDRLSRDVKVKWDAVYFVIRPFVYLLPEGVDEKTFFIKAYSAFLKHNIARHVSEICDSQARCVMTSKKWHYPVRQDESDCLPVSDRIDFLLNDDEFADEDGLKCLMDGYNSIVKKYSILSSSGFNQVEVPNVIFYIYGKDYVELPVNSFIDNAEETPCWVDEWVRARDAVSLNDNIVALKHYKESLEAAKYLAGPFFLPLYVEICAFCKNQYKDLKEKSEEYLFDRFYEPLGSSAAEYARLVGYSPGFSRDPETLMPKATFPKKHVFLMRKIDFLSNFLRG